MRTLTPQDLEDMLLGAGGGDVEEGRGMVRMALEARKSFELVCIEDVPNDAVICTPYLLGAVTPMTPDEEAPYAGLEKVEAQPLLTAYAAFQEFWGRNSKVRRPASSAAQARQRPSFPP